MKNIFKNIKNFTVNNLKSIVMLISLLVFIMISFQIYNYFLLQQLKKTSVEFFNSIEVDREFLDENDDSFYNILSKLKLIQKNNNNNNFEISNKLYKEIINSKGLGNIYISSISAHASYTLVNASYSENTSSFLDSISYYIENIDDNLENYYSIKKELKYLLVVTELDLSGIDYKNNTKVNDLYNEIYNSDLISSSIKERVKKIHEFHLFK